MPRRVHHSNASFQMGLCSGRRCYEQAHPPHLKGPTVRSLAPRVVETRSYPTLLLNRMLMRGGPVAMSQVIMTMLTRTRVRRGRFFPASAAAAGTPR